MPFADEEKKKLYHKEYRQRPEVKLRKKERYIRLHSKILKQKRLWWKKNKENISLKKKEAYKKNRKKIIEQVKKYYEKNKEKVHAKQKKWYKKNRKSILEKFKVTSHKWYENNKEKHIKKSIAWRKKHPEILQNYLNRKKRLGGTFSNEEWEEVKRRQNGICLRCKQLSKLSIDHIVPSTQWRKWRRKNKVNYRYNSIRNIQGLCSPCNSSKSDNL